MAAALSPATSLRIKPFSAFRFLSFYRQTTPIPTTNLPFPHKTIATTSVFPPKFLTPSHAPTIPDRRCFCTATELAAATTDEKLGEKIGEFRKRVSIVDIKGGPEDGVDKLGQDLTVRGWVRTVRVQSSVTFIEVLYHDHRLRN